MPVYEFHCDACKADFDEIVSMSARNQKVTCPKCGSKKTARKLSSVTVGFSEKEASGGGHGSGCGCCGGGGGGGCPNPLNQNWGDN